jgi:hypothetical protein
VEEPEEKKHRHRHRERRKEKIRVRTDDPPARAVKRFYKNYGRYLLLAIGVILAGLVVWYVLASIMPTLEKPPPSD